MRTRRPVSPAASARRAGADLDLAVRAVDAGMHGKAAVGRLRARHRHRARGAGRVPASESEIASSRLVLPAPFVAGEHDGARLQVERQRCVVAEIRQRQLAYVRRGDAYPRLLRPGSCTAVSALHAHRHQHVERVLVGGVADQRRRAGIGQHEHGLAAGKLGGDVEQVLGVEADLDRVATNSRRRAPRWRCPNRGC